MALIPMMLLIHQCTTKLLTPHSVSCCSIIQWPWVDVQCNYEWAGHNRFTRVISNTPAAIGEAASVMSLGAAATEEDGELIAKLFGAIGKIWKTDEKLFDAITRLSGSSPAYIYLVIEALADGGVAAVLPREPALGLASQTVN
ncbi:hypothetical protein HYC85_025661 [Camellia sinensis]|uniref:Pyrroline-5-carboxylate reductase dimerisation domain-containing protein n=1 Tax=Camellia sinensis TaxID=4442 RepID=A0A7J7GCY6_CAMSI|nr:hypothetical protein HYC85_025661 [Camellia sinensis]